MPLPTIPGIPPGIGSIGDIGEIADIGKAGPSEARQRGNIEGPSIGGPTINVATGKGSIEASGSDKIILYAAVGIILVIGIYLVRK